jgi:putative FmdB family regulatory protein
MPIREYQAKKNENSCSFCRDKFERFESMHEPPLAKCPECGAELARLISVPNVGTSQSGNDVRAKQAGFHKLKKMGKGEYEKVY